MAPRLIPAWDAYILGWKERSFAIPPEHAQGVFPGGGMFRPAALIDGRVEGVWQLRDGRVQIDAAPEVVQALEAEAEDVAAFG